MRDYFPAPTAPEAASASATGSGSGSMSMGCEVSFAACTLCGGKWYDPINGPGKPSNDSFNKDNCEQKEPDNNCIEQCMARKFAGPRPRYGIPFGTDCQEWSDDTLKDCQKQCKKK